MQRLFGREHFEVGEDDGGAGDDVGVMRGLGGRFFERDGVCYGADFEVVADSLRPHLAA